MPSIDLKLCKSVCMGGHVTKKDHERSRRQRAWRKEMIKNKA